MAEAIKGITAAEEEERNRAKALEEAVAKAKVQVAVAAAAAQKARKRRGLLTRVRIPGIEPRVTERELVAFTRQFATMIDSGLPLVQCLEVQCAQISNPTFQGQILKVKRRVESGSTLTTALEKFPSTFDTMYVSLVAAGEAGGMLDASMNRLASYIERANKLKKQAKAALVYPTAILSVAVVVVILLVLRVVPVFERMFGEFGEGLPPQTLAVIAISNFIRGNLLLIGSVILALVALGGYAYRTTRGRLFVDTLLIRLPVFGDIFTKIAVARFCQTLGTMLASGVPILGALDICARTSGNMVVERAVLSAKTGIAAGKTVSGPLLASGVFPQMVCQMLAVGESTGALDKMVFKVAEFYDSEVESAVGALTALLEPALMVFLGVVVGGLLLSMYLPIFTMASAVGGG